MIRYKINSDFICRKIAGEYVIVPTGEDTLFNNAMLSPNETAVFLWEQFQDWNSINAVVQACIEVYDVDTDFLTTEVEHFVKDLLMMNVILKEES